MEEEETLPLRLLNIRIVHSHVVLQPVPEKSSITARENENTGDVLRGCLAALDFPSRHCRFLRLKDEAGVLLQLDKV